MTVLAAFCVTAFADNVNAVETKVGDVKLYADKQSVQLGEMVTVTIYLENITAKAGILSFDWPLTYDKSKLSYIKREDIYPQSWGPYGDFLGSEVPSEEPWILRAVNEAGDMIENEAYRVKSDKEIGYKLTFKAVGEGEAFVAVEDHARLPIMLVSFDGRDVYNYGGKGMKLSIQIGAEDNSTEESVDSTEPDVSRPDESSEEISENLSSEDSSMPESSDAESSETSTEESADISTEASQSSAESSEAEDSTQAVTSEEEASGEQSSDQGNKDEDNDNSSFPVIPVVIGVAAVAVAGIGTFFYIKKTKESR